MRNFGFFVKALHADASGKQVSHGHDDPEEALRHAEELAAHVAMSDVLMVTNDSRQAVVRVFKGVQWFCEAQLNAQFAGWRHHHEEPAPDALRMPFVPPATDHVIVREAVYADGEPVDMVETVVERPIRGPGADDDASEERVA